VAGAGGAAS